MALGTINSGKYRYQVERKVGAGSFGQVFLAQRSVDGNVHTDNVALKFSKRRDEEDLAHEAGLAQAASSPNVVEVSALIRDAEVRASTADSLRRLGPALVMPAADFDLGHMLQMLRTPDGRALNDELVRSWATDIARGVSHLHSVEMIHRDIKPRNILGFYDWGGAHPGGFVKVVLKLADFGSARRLPSQGAVLRRMWSKRPPPPPAEEFAMTAHTCTSWYRAPELIVVCSSVDHLDVSPEEGVHEYGLPVDVWSYGAVVYEMLAGKPLARAYSGAEMVVCLIGALGPCPDAGPDSPTYALEPAWQALVKSAQSLKPRRPSLPVGSLWEVARACLKWHPQRRMGMSDVLARITQVGALPRISETAQREGIRHCPPPEDVPEVASLPSRSGTPPASGTAPAARGVCEAGGAADRFLRLDADPETTTTGPKRCKCSGHCRVYLHMKMQCCKSRDLVNDTNYCKSCGCSMPGRGRSRRRSDWCIMHRHVAEGLPAAARLAVGMRELAHLLVPVDVMDFLNLHEFILGDLAFTIIIALVKEPTATQVMHMEWKRLAPGYDGEALYKAFEEAIRVSASTPETEVQLEQLNRQGVARFMGLATTSVHMGVLRARSGESSEKCVSLGLTGLEYEFTGDHSRLSTFLDAVRAGEMPLIKRPCRDAGDLPPMADAGVVAMADVLTFSAELRGLLKSVGGRVPLGTKGGEGYVVDFIVRKLTMGRLAQWGLSLQTQSWSCMSRDQLRTISADSHELLSELPMGWSAEEVSAFVCGRRDWPFLASTYMCLWKDVADAMPSEYGRCFDVLQELKDAAQAFHNAHGFAPHPYVLVRAVGLLPPAKRRRKEIEPTAVGLLPTPAKKPRKVGSA